MAALFLFCVAFPGAGQAPSPVRPYHLQLEAQPAAVFPYLAKFGRIKLDVYPSGVRAETIWLNGFSRNGAHTITVENPLAPDVHRRSCVADVVASSEAGDHRISGAGVRAGEDRFFKGQGGGIAATRHRLMYGPTAWIDVWTTKAIPENPQFRKIVNDLVSAISPETGKLSPLHPGHSDLRRAQFSTLQEDPARPPEEALVHGRG